MLRGDNKLATGFGVRRLDGALATRMKAASSRRTPKTAAVSPCRDLFLGFPGGVSE
jgi:hypothetical protein